MKFRCERQALADALAIVVRASGSRTASSPVLAGVRIEVKGDSLSLACTDTDQIITCTIPVQGINNGVSVPRARLLNDIVRSLADGAVEVEVVGEDVVVSGGRSNFNVPTYMAQDFQVLPPAAAPDTSTNAEEFADALRQVARTVKNQDDHPYRGVQISHDADGVRLAATDNFRMALRKLPHSKILAVGEKVLVPGRALTELERMLPLSKDLVIRWADPTITFITGTASLTTRTINGSLPDPKMFLDAQYPNTLTVNRELILEALRRGKIVLPSSIGLKLHLSESGVRMEAADRDLGRTEEDLDAEYTGTDLSITFNVDYLMAGIEVVETEYVRIAMKDSRSPAAVWAADNEDYSYFIMPIRA